MNRAAAILLLGSLFTVEQALAQFDYSYLFGSTHSDNVERSSTDPQEDTTLEVGLRLDYTREQGRFNAKVGVDLRYAHFLDDSFDDESYGGMDATLAYWFIPERFSWNVEQNFGQALIDPRDVENPDNRQTVNFFSTGPDVIVPLGERTDLSVSGRWSDAHFGDTPGSNQRIDGTIGLVRHINEVSTVSVNAFAERVDFEDDFSDGGYDRQSAFVGYRNRGSRTSLDARAGYTVLHDHGEEIDGPLFDVTVSRQLSQRSSLTLAAGTNLTDSAEAFRRDQGVLGLGSDTQNVVISSDPYQSDFASLTWTADGTRNTFSLVGSWRHEDHEVEVDLNRQYLGATVDYSRRMRPTLSLGVQGGYTKEQYDNSDVEFDEWFVGTSLDWQFSRVTSVRFGYGYYEGSGDTLLGEGTRDYTENRLTLFFTYSPAR